MSFYRRLKGKVPENFPSASLVKRMLKYQIPMERFKQEDLPLRQFDNLEQNRCGVYTRIETFLSSETYRITGGEVVIGEKGVFVSDIKDKFRWLFNLDSSAYQKADPNLLQDLYREMIEYHKRPNNRKYGCGVLEVIGDSMKLAQIPKEQFSRRRRRIPFMRVG